MSHFNRRYRSSVFWQILMTSLAGVIKSPRFFYRIRLMRLSCEQHRFRSQKSTITSSVVFTSYLSEVIEHRGPVDVVKQTNKCYIMSFSRKRSPIHHTYFFNGTTLNRVFLYKDLGIHYAS
ncbi:hypothetical protein QTP88_011963 [Uroleucon formosanum]